MVTSDSPSTPPPQDGAVLPALSDGGSSGSAPSLKKGTKRGQKRVYRSLGQLGLYLRWFCRETRSMPATVESCSTRSRQL